MVKSSYADASELRFTLDRGKFFSVARALQRGFGKTLLGVVNVQVNDSTLTIDSKWGGSEIPCTGSGEVLVELTANAFSKLITPRFRERAPSGIMTLLFRPSLKEIATDDVGVRAKILSLSQ